ncbi:uncharacterized protein N7479_009975 [Penicillium vulpinum]|uniref:DUF2306 domain-containing protein n=1 Tax=Penicillium vulpinum TaxID=29845 RepID=A0A1V6RBT2_9EURO|nr:uncharacterized protein N7479_009975 [Penicillium vulpinum]KAJ5951562.1 hypothetical protein N7479_009975 [Penicillium vulpinum]OQD98990.1 hypothetical protein PENVUL_c067G02650 [Penicillium vulpinum]
MKEGQSAYPSTAFRWWMMAFPAFLVSFYAVQLIYSTPPGDASVKARILPSISGWIHIIGGGVAILLGPFQFIESIRRKSPWVHRWIGRVYVAAIFASGFSGLQISFRSVAYSIGRYGFAALAIVWLITMFMGVFTIWNGNISGHREWMTRNFSLTYAAVMLRWQLPLLMVSGLTVSAALTITGFSCWIPNLIFVEWYIGNRKNRKFAIE